jgi:hypothetical protein
VRWTDLGFVDTREDRYRVCEQLSSLPDPPRVSIIVSSLTTTPDRGVASFIERIGEAAHGPVALVLTSGQTMRERVDGDSIIHRIEDWRQLASDCGLDDARVVEIDLDHLTDISRQRLEGLIDGTSIGEEGGRRLEESLDLIADASGSWSQSPDAKTQTDLHRQIAALHGSETRTWRDLLHVPAAIGPDLPDHVRSSANRMLALLPDRLKASPKWMAAGAAAGAFGCVAAAMLLSPAAIGALPMWSGIGAAITGVVRTAMGDRSGEAETTEDIEGDSSRAIRAATLFAVLLELQGRDETEISRVLDRTLPDDDELIASSTADVRHWLDDVRHRFDMALTAEGRP